VIQGSFLPDEKLPTIPVTVVFGQAVLSLDFILDTGFSGDLKISERTANDLGIVAQTATYIVNASGESVPVGVAQGYAEMEGRKAPITINITNGPYLAGIGLFSVFGYKAVVDCKNRSAYLE
jgi:predicted aspartyl protease